MVLEPDEPAAGPRRVVELGELVDLIVGSGRPWGRPRIVAVDGRGGAGKSTLVERMRALVPRSAVVHTDDVAWHHAFFGWADLLGKHVLEPLRRGDGVDYRPPAWLERGRAGSILVAAGLDVVFVEGTGIVRSELAPLIDASVWVQVDAVEAARRLVARDGDSPEQRRLVDEWNREEGPFLLRERPWERADVVVVAGQVLEHDPATSVVIAPAVAPGS